MKYKSSYKWKLIVLLIFVLFSAVFTANYFYFVSYRPLGGKAPIALIYDAGLATIGSVLRRIDLRRDKPNNKVPEIHIVVEPSSLETMVSDLPDSAKAHYYKARLLYPDEKWRRVKYRLRGRNIWHWSEQKPSIRIKTRKQNPISLHRHLNLINPEDVMMLANPYGEELSRKFDVLAPNTELVKLYINKKYKGLYHLTNREDESFLRFNRRFPGPLYVGNYLKKEWAAEDFELEGDLDVLEFSNPMKEVTDLISQDLTLGQLKTLWTLVDKDKLASWAALMTVISGTHSDFKHNQVFYFDPTTGKIEPVVSDILALGVILYPEVKERLYQKWKPSFNVPIHERITPILAAAMADPSFVYLKNQKVYDALTSFASADAQIKLLENMSRNIEDAIFADPNKAALQRTAASWYRMPYSNFQYNREKTRVREFITSRVNFVKSELQKSNIFYYETSNNDSRINFVVEVSGHSAVQFSTEEYLKSYSLQIMGAAGEMMSVKQNLLLYPALYRHTPQAFHPRVVGRRSPEYMLIPGTHSYQFSTSKDGWDFIQSNADLLFKNSVTGESVSILETSPTLENDKIHTVFMLPKTENKNSDIVLGPGTIKLNQDLIVPEIASLKILSGTEILLDEGVSIISRGKVLIEGTKNAPVILRQLKSDKPWGVFAIVGKAASHSQLSHIDISGGSSTFRQNINFSGMLSIHHLDNIKLKNVTISNNTIGDDTLRIISSHVDAENITAYSCASDCIDFDFVEGTAKNINIKDAGNDGFDFMSSNVKIENYAVENCGDKGISIGELSNIAGQKITISNCIFGIAAKDNSLGTFQNLTITESDTGISSYRKNWRYGDAGAIIADPLFFGNIKNWEEKDGKKRDSKVGLYPNLIW